MQPYTFADAHKDFTAAELLLKRAGFLTDEGEAVVGVPVPALNELRLAGQHILRAITDTDNEAHHLDDAKDHIRRAKYEAGEMIISTYVIKYGLFMNTRFARVGLSEVVGHDEANKIKKVFREAQNFLGASQGASNRGNHAEAYADQALGIIEPLKIQLHLLEDHTEDFIRIQRKERNKFFGWLVTVLLSLAVIIVTIVK